MRNKKNQGGKRRPSDENDCKVIGRTAHAACVTLVKGKHMVPRYFCTGMHEGVPSL